MTRSNKTTTCKVCGSSDVVSYRKKGKVFKRRFCASHWASNNSARHAAKRDGEQAPKYKSIPPGWERNYRPDSIPPEGVTRIVVNVRRRRLITYSGFLKKSVEYTKFKVMNDRETIITGLIRIGYQLVILDQNRIVLEKYVTTKVGELA